MDALTEMNYHLEPAGSLPKYRQIAKTISAYLCASQTPAGTKLPNDRVLAKRFNTAVMTMAKALNDLAARGLLERKVGSGTFVRDTGKMSPFNRRIAIVSARGIQMEGGFVTSLLTELYRQAPEYCFDLLQLQRSPDEYLDTMDSFQLDGLIVLSAESDTLPLLAKFAAEGINILQIGYWHETYSEISFGTDHKAVAEKAVQYLYDLGHRDIRIIVSKFNDGTIHSSNLNRISGYKDSMQKLGLSIVPEWIISDLNSAPCLKKNLQNLISANKLPSAFLVLNLPMVPKIYHIMQSIGIQIPQNVSLVGFDESYLNDQLTPGFTAFSQNMPELVKKAMQRLTEQKVAPIQPISPILIARSSCQKKQPKK